MQQRFERTIRRPATCQGIGYLTGADVTLRFLPAPPRHGIVFQRVDCAGSKPIPARIEFALPRERRTAVGRDGVVVEMTEHVLAALAGLQVDNCLIEMDSADTPGGDGSAMLFAETILEAGIIEQNEIRRQLYIDVRTRIAAPNGRSDIEGRPLGRGGLAISYKLDYGPRSPIPAQDLTVEISPETFLDELAFARTFLLESEVAALRAQGYGRRTTEKDLLLFGSTGVVGNVLRAPDECVRHKILDCLGDFALLGADLLGHVIAYRTGHELNRELIRRLREQELAQTTSSAA